MGDKWGKNGPQLLSRVITKKCKLESKTLNVTCNKYKPELTVLARTGSSPVTWQKWRDYFNPNVTEKTLKKAENSFAVHYWNHMRDANPKKSQILYDPETAIYKLFEANCPLVEAMDLKGMQGQVFS